MAAPTIDDVLGTLHRQGSGLVTHEVLEAHATPIDDYEFDGERYPCVVMANGVRWFYDRERRPPGRSGPRKAIAPEGVPRALLGEVEAKQDPVLFEGERDWLTALSVGLKGALCAGGATNLDDAQVALLAPCPNVVVMFDADEPGRHAADALAAQLVEAGCRSVKIARIPLADADYSDWAESLPPGQVLEQTLGLIQAADKVGKRDAKRIRREQQEERKPAEVDEFSAPGGDLVVAVWKPGDPATPHRVDLPGSAAFAHHDRAASQRSGLLVVNEVACWENEPAPADDGVPDAYAQQDHRRDLPPVLVPLGGETFQKRIVVVPSGAKEHGSSEALFDDLVALIDAYFVADPRFLSAMASYVLLTYRYQDAGYEVLPYIRVVGQAGKGKTRFLRIMRELCFRSVFVAGIRPAHLYRILEYFPSGITMVFEEFNLDDRSAEAREYVDMLNAGNQRGTFVPRMAGRQFNEISWLPLFSPKVLTTTNDLLNEGLVRRSLTTRLGTLPIPAEKRFSQLPDEFYARCASLRRRLLGWRFAKRGLPVNEHAEKRRGDMDAGLWQNYFPLVAMVPEKRPGATEAILELAGVQWTEMETTQSSAPTARALEVANFAVDAEHNRAWTQDVLDHLSEADPRDGWTLLRVRRALRAAGLELHRSSKLIDGRKKFDFYVEFDDAFVECLRQHGLDAAIGAEEERKARRASDAGIM